MNGLISIVGRTLALQNIELRNVRRSISVIFSEEKIKRLALQLSDSGAPVACTLITHVSRASCNRCLASSQ